MPIRRDDEPVDFQVNPFTVVVDSREQAPFGFRNLTSDVGDGKRPLIVSTEKQGLKTGDYSIAGYEDQVAIERKSLSDFLGCCGNDRKRFQKQLERLNEIKVAYVVVEAGWPSILAGHEHSRLNPKTVFRSVLAWQQRLPGIHWMMCSTRSLAEVATFRILERFWKDLDRDGK